MEKFQGFGCMQDVVVWEVWLHCFKTGNGEPGNGV